MSTIVYGIPNCDTVKKTQHWLKQHAIPFQFHDYKQAGISKEKLQAWSKQVGWETLLNKKSTTWRNLSAEEQAAVKSEASAIKLMMNQNSIIKRPVIESAGNILVGFDEASYNKHFKVNTKQ